MGWRNASRCAQPAYLPIRPHPLRPSVSSAVDESKPQRTQRDAEEKPSQQRPLCVPLSPLRLKNGRCDPPQRTPRGAEDGMEKRIAMRPASISANPPPSSASLCVLCGRRIETTEDAEVRRGWGKKIPRFAPTALPNSPRPPLPWASPTGEGGEGHTACIKQVCPF